MKSKSGLHKSEFERKMPAASLKFIYKSMKRLSRFVWILVGVYIIILIHTSLLKSKTTRPFISEYDAMANPKVPEGLPTSQIYGFQYCSHLDGSTFILNAKPSFGTHPKSSQFTAEFDRATMVYTEHLAKQQSVPSEADNLKRAACYLMATGRSETNTVNLIAYFESSIYFPLVSYRSIHEATIESSEVPHHTSSNTSAGDNSREEHNNNTSMRRANHQMAYVLLAHDNSQLNNIKLILKELVYQQSNSIVLIHVDLKAKGLIKKLYEWIEQYFQPPSQHGQIMLTQKIRATWGTVNLVYATLDSMFNLLDAADWEYVAVLSTSDWPLMSASGMYQSLKSAERDGTRQSWVEASTQKQFSDRWMTPYTLSAIGEMRQIEGWNFPIPFHETIHWNVYKHPQWVVLARDHVQAFRSDPRLISWLAFVEFVFIPDEIYFGTGLMAIDQLRRNTYRIPTTFARFSPFSYHPDFIDYERRHSLLVAEPPEPENDLYPYLFARKIDMTNDSRFKKWIDQKLRNPDPLAPCEPEDTSYRVTCLAEVLRNISTPATLSLPYIREQGAVLDSNYHSNSTNEIPAIIPINFASRHLAMNLVCSLPFKNVLFWSLDEVVHNILINNQFLSYHNQRRFNRNAYEFTWADIYEFQQFGKEKLSFLKMVMEKNLLKKGFWALDADVVVLKDLNDFISRSSGVDLLVMVDALPGHHKRRIPFVSTGVMYVNNTAGALKILEYMEHYSETLHDDSVALNQFLADQEVGIQASDDTWIKTCANRTSPVVKLISSTQIINGHMFYSYDMTKTDAYAVHLNGILEMEEKRIVFEKHNLWFKGGTECTREQQILKSF